MKKKKGFTLIELLICVLIIGILAGIGIGQYKKVVLKSRASKAITALKTLYESQRRYYLSNNKHYTKDLTALDVQLEDDDYYYFHCGITSGIIDCYSTPKNGSRPAFEQYGTILFCRGSAKQCKPFTTKQWENHPGYWIIHE